MEMIYHALQLIINVNDTQEMSCSSKSLNDLKIFVRERERETEREKKIDIAYNERS